MHGGGELTDERAESGAACCPSLPSLDVSECGNLTDEALKAVAASCPCWASLVVSKCGNLTDGESGGNELPRLGQPQRELER